jgi:hypothetical protein
MHTAVAPLPESRACPSRVIPLDEQTRHRAAAGIPDVEAWSSTDEQLRRAARFLCAEARASESPIEPLLAALERKWLALPAGELLPDPPRRTAVWKRLVALCLEEFYAQLDARDVVAVRPGLRRV